MKVGDLYVESPLQVVCVSFQVDNSQEIMAAIEDVLIGQRGETVSPGSSVSSSLVSSLTKVFTLPLHGSCTCDLKPLN
jgi:hypothetical protein